MIENSPICIWGLRHKEKVSIIYFICCPFPVPPNFYYCNTCILALRFLPPFNENIELKKEAGLNVLEHLEQI